MLITHFKFSSYNINTVVHVGANVGEELQFYKNLGVKNLYFFEPRLEAVANLYDNCKKYKDAMNIYVHPYGLGSENEEKTMYSADQSSSFLIPKNHTIVYPNIRFSYDNMKTFSVRRGDTALPKNLNIDMLNIDAQGYELEILKGMGNMLNRVKVIYTEIFTDELYAGCPTIGTIDNYLNSFGFKRVEALVVPEKWGDAIYVRQ